MEGERVSLDFKELATDAANLLFWELPDEDRVRNAIEEMQAFQFVTKAGDDNVRDWYDSLMELVPMYVLQWNTEDREPKEYEFAARFGELLFGLLQAVE